MRPEVMLKHSFIALHFDLNKTTIIHLNEFVIEFRAINFLLFS